MPLMVARSDCASATPVRNPATARNLILHFIYSTSVQIVNLSKPPLDGRSGALVCAISSAATSHNPPCLVICAYKLARSLQASFEGKTWLVRTAGQFHQRHVQQMKRDDQRPRNPECRSLLGIRVHTAFVPKSRNCLVSLDSKKKFKILAEMPRGSDVARGEGNCTEYPGP